MTGRERRAIADIRIGERHRKALGDLSPLATSIAQEGLLQPIGILADNTLVFGERRLVACRDQLGWTEIEVRIVDVSSIAAGEYAENEVRKNFTLSERVAIMQAIKQEIGNRQGQRTDQLPPNWGEVAKSRRAKETGAIAAKRAGFSSTSTAERAVTALGRAGPELSALMDADELSVEAAYQLSQLPKPEQAQRVAAAKASGVKLRGKGHPKTAVKPAAPPPPRKLGHILLERAARAAAMPELTLAEKGYPPPELAHQQHPDAPPGTTYAMKWREDNGRVQLWPQAEKQKILLTGRFQEAIGQLAKIDPADWPAGGEIENLNPDQRDLIRFSIRKVLARIMPRLHEWEAAACEDADVVSPDAAPRQETQAAAG